MVRLRRSAETWWERLVYPDYFKRSLSEVESIDSRDYQPNAKGAPEILFKDGASTEAAKDSPALDMAMDMVVVPQRAKLVELVSANQAETPPGTPDCGTSYQADRKGINGRKSCMVSCLAT